ncbi:hypothetical protein CCO03_04615 [Comamonas serinivorans]|uniref:DUF2322 domain-containing protein n=1 Tax=Comamonas serinivorans TaxID=1082851 RepID=A0A1Y0EL64_9BURK|nr:DUF2322 family protein [Comamonas serinivorans]ARU04052.1 hypothetical protein CCO03_04615 [Comamonas serinivorans]
MSFADNLRDLPAIDHLAALELLDEAGQVVASIPNQPGKAGSLKLYAALAARHGAINLAAAEEGLALFAEHTEDARQHPGSHPNIDRLFEVIATGKPLSVRLLPA